MEAASVFWAERRAGCIGVVRVVEKRGKIMEG